MPHCGSPVRTEWLPAGAGRPVIIDADDLGCMADGRWLREISISAGSRAVTVPAGAVLAGDVGASISIPGAADMETTIELLPDAKTVVNTAIGPGDPTTLMVTLTGNEGPFVPKHEGWRIVVDGAGRTGSRCSPTSRRFTRRPTASRS